MYYFLDPLPSSIVIDGSEVRINTDFRAILNYNRIIQKDSGEGENIIDALMIIFPDGIPSDIEKAIEGLEEFVDFGEVSKYNPSKKLLGLNNNRAMDFEADGHLIWSAFFRTYGIDLRSIEYLHWWDFIELLEELPEDVRLEKVINYRTVDTNNPRISKEEKKVLDAMQKKYKITEKKTKREEALADALRKGEDISSLL